MASLDPLRRLGLFDARAPRYTSYPPANHFSPAVGPDRQAAWLAAVPAGGRVSLYVHVPYCRRLCWFCACRTQGTQTDRPLAPYLDQLLSELALIDRHLPRDVQVSALHLGGGTPTLLPPTLLSRLAEALRAFRPLAPDFRFSVEVDPTEIDAPRVAALAAAGMTRASIGVQDFDTEVQEAIGRSQSPEETARAVTLLRAAGIRSLNVDLLFGLPHQTTARIARSVRQVLDLRPDRVALYGYAHVPWMAKRQALIPSEALPEAEERLRLFETARRLFLWAGYREIGIDHFALPGEALAVAADQGRMHRNFQGYTEDEAPVLIGLGASAISRFPQGYAQNVSTSSRYAAALAEGVLPTERGHEMTPEDRLRADMIEEIMCSFTLSLPDHARRHGVPVPELLTRIAPLRQRFAGLIEEDPTEGTLRLGDSARLIARLVARSLDSYEVPQDRHSSAI